MYKKSVRNPRYPEGCIAEQYVTQECVTYCNLYMEKVNSFLETDVEKRFDISVYSELVKPLGLIRRKRLGQKALNFAHWAVLENCHEAKHYLASHEQLFYAQYPHSTHEERVNDFRPYFLTWVRVSILNINTFIHRYNLFKIFFR